MTGEFGRYLGMHQVSEFNFDVVRNHIGQLVL